MTTILSESKRLLLYSRGHILATGGPGSGKTHIALIKGDYEYLSGGLKSNQKLLFMSFARSTVARIEEQLSDLVCKETQDSIDVTTYHGFTWRILRSHGYLLSNSASPLRVITPPEAYARLSKLDAAAFEREIERLFYEDGEIHMDLFAPLCTELLSRSQSLLSLYSDKYPVIVLDEFQDTNSKEWGLIKLLGGSSRLIALADPHQRIYRFRGADPNRLQQFKDEFRPLALDFEGENFRSSGKDITAFGNDLLDGSNKGKTYNDVSLYRYGYYRGRSPHYFVKTKIIQRLRGLNSEGWSLAVLVPTGQLMLLLSQYLSSQEDGLPAIRHEVAIDAEAPCLAALVLARLLELGSSRSDQIVVELSDRLVQYLNGRRGSKGATQEDTGIASALTKFCETGEVRGSYRKSLTDSIVRISDDLISHEFSGTPEKDWSSVAAIVGKSQLKHLDMLLKDAQYVRLLRKGSSLRRTLSELWSDEHNYSGAFAAFESAYKEEYFATKRSKPAGLMLMTLHKSKGKQFSEVIIYEDRHQSRLLREGSSAWEQEECIYTLRVGVTRASDHTTIMTPTDKPSGILV